MADDAEPRAWHDIVRDVLKRHNVSLVAYVPDNVLRPLIAGIHADPFFTPSPSRGRKRPWASRRRLDGRDARHPADANLGFRHAAERHRLAVRAVPIPTLMMVSERGTLGEFNIGQSLVARTMRPVLDALAVEHHTMTRLDEVEFIVDRSIVQAVATLAPVCFILSPLLTGGKVFAK